MTLLDARGLVKYFPVTAGLLRRRVGDVKAVDGVSLAIEEGTTLALVGETGSGKTTLGRLLTRLLTATNGQIVFERRDITGLDEQARRPVRRQMQMVFQNPASSLNPRRRVKEIIEEPLVVHGIGTPVARLRQVRELLELVAAERLFTSPSHPYTRALLSAIPTVSDEEAALIPEKIVLRGEIPSPSRVPPGCAFHPRCYARIDGCDRVVPELITLGDGHAARCILYDPALGAPGLPNVIARRE